jgi:aspartokinase-like uncharacterized kinase
MTTPTIVKLGGSYAFSPHLPNVVAAIAATRVPIVIVPGGGPFADNIRTLQSRMGFSDDTAHRLALLAMCQFGEMLCGFHQKFRALNLAHFPQAFSADEIPVWMPWPLTGGLETVPASWDITSDSLAAWLAARLSAERLFLLKSVELPSAHVKVGELAQTGLVDPAFPSFIRKGNFQTFWFAPAAIGDLPLALDGGQNPGIRLE